jgi:hypothetical protein
MFFTSCQDKRTGKEVLDSHQIAKSYIKQFRFKIDVLSLLGSAPLVAINKRFKFLGLFKMFRVFRLSKMISEANVSTEKRILMNLAKLFLYMLFYLHIIGTFLWAAI